MLEPKPKHAGVVIGVAIAGIVGLFRGTKMSVSNSGDFIAVVIAFILVIGIFAGGGYIIDRYIYKRHKKEYNSFITQQQFNYGDEETSPADLKEDENPQLNQE